MLRGDFPMPVAAILYKSTMFSKSLVIFSSIAAAAALATGPAPDVGETITVCSGTIIPRNGCIDIPIVSDTCRSFTGGLTFLNNQVSNASVPLGYVCTFFDAAGCISKNDTEVVFLQGGTWDFFRVPGIAKIVNFNDRASSFVCSTF
ncbi:hypothetical protein C8J57DRAFT_1570049 [Mycena rebaudengoi]|nr:hypothetical protein C8J57DRAFT_1570049 [Mycena rebaudengoi]